MRGLFLRAFVLLPLMAISLRWRGFRKSKWSLQHFLSVPYASKNPDAQARAAQFVPSRCVPTLSLIPCDTIEAISRC